MQRGTGAQPASRQGSGLGALGALVGGAMGALAGGLTGGMQAQQAHELVRKIFASTRQDARQIAEKSLSDGVISEVYEQEMLTATDMDQVFREKVRALGVGQQAGVAKMMSLELLSLCLCIEVLRL